MNRGLELSRIVLICESPSALARFYERALGFSCSDEYRLEGQDWGELIAVAGAAAQVLPLRLGHQRVDLVCIEPGGCSYPKGVLGPSALFQHFAIQVADLPGAMTRLRGQPSWSPISVGGPQLLPPASGGVTAFKFRDPEGHPLELITPPSAAAATPRITHSAISVQATDRSVAFYEQLGLTRSGGSMNVGPEQDRLDGLCGTRVAVTALSTGVPDGLHLELLCYGNQFQRPAIPAEVNDVAASWLVLTVGTEEDLRSLLQQIQSQSKPTRSCDGALRVLIRDPDGHRLCLEVPAGNSQPPVANPG